MEVWSNQGLLALIIAGCDKEEASDSAANVLNTYDSNLIHVFCASIEQLQQIEGIKFSKACKIKATFELTKRIASYCEEEHPVIACIILLDSKQKLIRADTVSLGSLDKALVEPRDVFRPAITAATGLTAGPPTVIKYTIGNRNDTRFTVLQHRYSCFLSWQC